MVGAILAVPVSPHPLVDLRLLLPAIDGSTCQRSLGSLSQRPSIGSTSVSPVSKARKILLRTNKERLQNNVMNRFDRIYP